MIIIESVNVGQPAGIAVGGREATSGIFKRPVDHPVEVRAEGITGDAVCNRKHHGGPDQALYLYRVEDYEWWSRELGRTVDWGTFGENLSVSGIAGPAVMVGDRLRFRQVELEVSSPRIPCNVLAARMGDKQFARRFVEAERPGFYVRVLTPGIIGAGEKGELIPFEGDSIATTTFFRDYYRKLSATEIRRYLALPIASRARRDLEDKLEKAWTEVYE